MMHYRDDDEDSNDDFMGNMGAYDAQSNPLGLSKAELRKVRVPPPQTSGECVPEKSKLIICSICLRAE